MADILFALSLLQYAQPITSKAKNTVVEDVARSNHAARDLAERKKEAKLDPEVRRTRAPLLPSHLVLTSAPLFLL